MGVDTLASYLLFRHERPDSLASAVAEAIDADWSIPPKGASFDYWLEDERGDATTIEGVLADLERADRASVLLARQRGISRSNFA
ncbi:hypothetical protein ACFQH6_18690 [Halobacteriaceae archaeon GCM10025711]